MLAIFMRSPCDRKKKRDEAKKTSKQCESFASNLWLPIFGFQSLASNVPRELANSGLTALHYCKQFVPEGAAERADWECNGGVFRVICGKIGLAFAAAEFDNLLSA
jgi:hypothetical protein